MKFSKVLPPFYNVSHSSIFHIHIDVSESRHIYLYISININMNVKNVRDLYCETEEVPHNVTMSLW